VDVLVMPYADGASLRRGTLMAGLANGCAIVTTIPQMPLPDMHDGRDWLTVPPNDADATAQAVLRIADDPMLAETLRANARERSYLYRWENIAARHLSLYGLPTSLADSSRLLDDRS
jgi:glycosyltransferase involved in cell wall biosynthesis